MWATTNSAYVGVYLLQLAVGLEHVVLHHLQLLLGVLLLIQLFHRKKHLQLRLGVYQRCVGVHVGDHQLCLHGQLLKQRLRR